jgi:hypothetical protein
VRRGWLVCVSAAALWAAACSGNGSAITPPPPNNGFTNSNLQGQYAFSMAGTDASTGVAVPFARIGSFTADGQGNITAGVEDVNLNFAQQGSPRIAFTSGTYSISSDGRGTLTLNNSTGSLKFSIALTSGTSGYLVFMPSDGLSTGSGSFVKQNTASFSLPGVAGSYAFDLSGVDSAGNGESFVGQVVSNGSGTFTSGLLDDNDGGTLNNGGGTGASISGTYGIDGTNTSDLSGFGRGVFTIAGTVTGVFYVVGPNQIKLMETTTGGTLLGDAFLQSNIPTTTAGITGGFVYVMGGSTAATSGFGPVTRGGKFSASGGNLANIIVDTNNAGTSTSFPNTGGTSSGTYTIDASGSGRGTISYTVQGLSGTLTYVFYLISPTQGFVQDQTVGTNGAFIEDGSMFAQGTSSITSSSLAGNYAITWSGITSINGGNQSGEEDVDGQTTLNSSNALAGTIDLSEFASGGQGTGIGLTGTLQLSSDPTTHNTLTLNLATTPANKITAFAYVAANNNILIMTTQGVRIAAGVMTPQVP